MARKKAGIAIAAAVLIAILAFAGLAKADERRPVLPKKGPGKSNKWGDPRPDSPPDYDDPKMDLGGPGIWISPDCEVIYEGGRFWPDPYELDRNPDKEGTPSGKKYDPDVARGRGCNVDDVRGLASSVDPDCTGLDYVDELILDGFRDPIDIGRDIATKLAPLCMDADPATWPDAFLSWYNFLVDRLTQYVEEKIFWLEEQGYE